MLERSLCSDSIAERTMFAFSVQYILQLLWHRSHLGDGKDPAQATTVIQIGLCWVCGWLTAKMVNFVNWRHTVGLMSAYVGTVAEAWNSSTIMGGMARGPSMPPHPLPRCTLHHLGQIQAAVG